MSEVFLGITDSVAPDILKDFQIGNYPIDIGKWRLIYKTIDDIEVDHEWIIAHSELLMKLQYYLDLIPLNLKSPTDDKEGIGRLIAKSINKVSEQFKLYGQKRELTIYYPEDPIVEVEKNKSTSGKAYLQHKLKQMQHKEERKEQINALLEEHLPATLRNPEKKFVEKNDELIGVTLLFDRKTISAQELVANFSNSRATLQFSGPWYAYSFVDLLLE